MDTIKKEVVAEILKGAEYQGFIRGEIDFVIGLIEDHEDEEEK